MTDYPTPGAMAEQLLKYVKKGLRHQICLTIKRIYIVKPDFDFSDLDKEKFEEGMNAIFPNKGETPKISVSDRLEQVSGQDIEVVGNKWTIWEYVKDDRKGKKLYCQHCDSE